MFHREGPMTIGLHEEIYIAVARMNRSTDADILLDVTASVDYIKAQSFVRGDKIGIIGYCYGGRVSYLVACNITDLSPSVVFYGGGINTPLGDGPSPLDQTANIGCPILGLFGVEDTNPNPEDVGKRGKSDQHLTDTARFTNSTTTPAPDTVSTEKPETATVRTRRHKGGVSRSLGWTNTSSNRKTAWSIDFVFKGQLTATSRLTFSTPIPLLIDF
jgi:hypothetical protein